MARLLTLQEFFIFSIYSLELLCKGGTDLMPALNNRAQLGLGQPVEDPVPRKSKPGLAFCDALLSHDDDDDLLA